MKDKLSNILTSHGGYSKRSWCTTLVFHHDSEMGVTFMDLSKAFDNLNQRLLLANLKGYGLLLTGLKKWKTTLQVVFKNQKSVIVIVHGLK